MKKKAPPMQTISTAPELDPEVRVDWPKTHTPGEGIEYLMPGKSVEVRVYGKVTGMRVGGEFGGNVSMKPTRITIHPGKGEPDEADMPMTERVKAMRGGMKRKGGPS